MKRKLYLLLGVVFIVCNLNSSRVYSQLSVATFENLELEPESYWFYDPNNEPVSFVSGSFSFPNSSADYGAPRMYWDGFSYSNLTLNASSLPNDDKDFATVAGKGANGSNTFAILNYAYYNPAIITLDEPATVPGVYITNSLYAYDSMVNGDPFAGDAFEKGDFLKVNIMPFDDALETENIKPSIELYLADYRSEDPAEHHILTDWQWVDLSSLGKVSAITFSFEGSRNNEYGLLTPAYLCLDDLGAADPGQGNGIDRPNNLSAKSSVSCNDGIITVYTSLNEYTINIYSTTGSLLYKGNSRDAEIDASNWVKGVYIVEIASNSGRETCKFVR